MLFHLFHPHSACIHCIADRFVYSFGDTLTFPMQTAVWELIQPSDRNMRGAAVEAAAAGFVLLHWAGY